MNDVNPQDAGSPLTVTFDAVMPAALAARAEEAGVRRAGTDPLNTLVLSVLGGAFVAFGAIFATTVSAGSIAISSAADQPTVEITAAGRVATVDNLIDTPESGTRTGSRVWRTMNAQLR